jgi:hypothetical protein
MLNFEKELISNFELAEYLTFGLTSDLEACVDDHQLLRAVPFVYSNFESWVAGFFRGVSKSTPNNHPQANIISRKNFDNEYIKIAYETAPEALREAVGLPKDKIFEHDIDTGDAAAVKVHGCPYSPPEHLLIDQFIKEGLKDGIIRPTKSPWSAPIILVKKPDGTSRACVDY